MIELAISLFTLNHMAQSLVLITTNTARGFGKVVASGNTMDIVPKEVNLSLSLIQIGQNMSTLFLVVRLLLS